MYMEYTSWDSPLTMKAAPTRNMGFMYVVREGISMMTPRMVPASASGMIFAQSFGR